MNRKEEYQDERWKARAEEIRELDHHRCAMCGAEGVELHVHHLAYPPPPFHLWDANDRELVTLCKDCHEKIHQSISRPTLDKDRKLHCCMFQKDKCVDCRRFIQPYFFRYGDEAPTSVNFVEHDFYPCERLGGEGCNFKEPIKCKDCTFLSSCFGVSEQTLACCGYEHKRCQFCRYFYTKLEDGCLNDYCGFDGHEESWGNFDCCEHFNSRVENPREVDEYLKKTEEEGIVNPTPQCVEI